MRRGIFRYFVIGLLFLVLLRLFPFVIRVVQILAVGVRAYWWAILPAIIVIWIIRKARQKKDPSAFEKARDVTNSNR